ncbi:RNA polymerase sigma-70 factor [Odoribacter sp. Z80]|nr:RNA polymerase sigma-70 factor [Odoribacter sp. Z80]
MCVFSVLLFLANALSLDVKNIFQVVMGRETEACDVKILFENSFREFFKSLCFHAMSFVKDEEVAKDVVHDVFLTVWVRRDEIDFAQPILPYLLSLTRHRAINYLEHLKVKVRHAEQKPEAEEVYLPADDAGHEELILKIKARIGTLPDRCREVMFLYLIECKKYKEIAEILGISVNTVKTHISTGLKYLREEFPASLLLLCFPDLKNY